MENAKPERLHYIDWLRVLVVLSLIPFHAALTYLRFGIVYIKAPLSGAAALPFLAVSVPLGDFFMTLLFFVSGVASFHSVQARGIDRYRGERFKKLMLPFFLGFLLLCPETAYLQALYEGYQGGFLSFIPQFFYYKLFYYPGYGHLWFLLYLYVFSMLCAPLFRRWQADGSRIERIGTFIMKGHRLLLPIGVIILLELLLRPFFHDKQTLIFDWANDAVYLAVFVFGYVFAADARIQEKVRGYFKPAAIAAALSLATLFYVNIQSQMLYSNEPYLTPLWVLAKGVYECSGIIFLLCIGKNRLNRESRLLGALNKSSFTIYIFHYLPVTLFTLLFIGLPMPAFMKFLLVVVLSYLTLFLICVLARGASALLERRKLQKW